MIKNFYHFIVHAFVWFIILFVVCFLMWAFSSLIKVAHYDNGMIDATTNMQKQAISAGVAEFVITDKMTGAAEFRWKTNNFKYLFK